MAMHHLRSNPATFDGHRGSIVMTASTSGYFGASGVVAYVASKHGIVGLLRSSQSTARKYGIRVNAVAPYFTPTHITTSFSEDWKAKGLPANTVNDVANALVRTAADQNMEGQCLMVRFS